MSTHIHPGHMVVGAAWAARLQSFGNHGHYVCRCCSFNFWLHLHSGWLASIHVHV
jgi:hypothetical protein